MGIGYDASVKIQALILILVAVPALAQAGSPRASSYFSTPDSQLVIQEATWVQIVKANGEKVNIKAEPGKPVDFQFEGTAAVIFGRPDKASLRIKGRFIDVTQFVINDSPRRALVILNQIDTLFPKPETQASFNKESLSESSAWSNLQPYKVPRPPLNPPGAYRLIP